MRTAEELTYYAGLYLDKAERNTDHKHEFDVAVALATLYARLAQVSATKEAERTRSWIG